MGDGVRQGHPGVGSRGGFRVDKITGFLAKFFIYYILRQSYMEPGWLSTG